MVDQPIQTRLTLLFTNSNVDVSESLLPDLTSFSYTDNETEEADEISISLKDDTGKWAGNWKPDGGEVVRAIIKQGTTKEITGTLNCGKFYIDSLNAAGGTSGRTFDMSAVSIPLNKPIRRKLKSKAWEKKTLKGIAEEIATEADLELIFDSSENPSYDRQDQNRESDLQFLLKLCEESGLSLKLTDEKLVIFDLASYEKKDPIKTIELGKSKNISSWNFQTEQSETYRSCTITYRDPKKKVKGSSGGYNMDLEKVSTKKENPAVRTYTYTDPLADENGQEYSIKKRAKSLEEAKRLARATLRKLNRRHITGNLTVIGDVSLVAGVVIQCKGFGSMDGNFAIKRATHSVSTSGYTTAVELRRVNANY